jgi:hypothetical protein
MQTRLFTVFHRAVDLNLIFPSLSDQDVSGLVSLYAVAERHPEKWVILKDGRRVAAHEAPGTVFEQDLPYYDPQLQARGFMETSAYIHILKNNLHMSCDHVGISQYDMRWTDESMSQLREITAAASPTVGAMIMGELMNSAGEFDRRAYYPNFNWDFLLASYNRHFGTNWEMQALAQAPLTLFQTYLMPRAEFTALASWLEKLCGEVWPWANQPPYRTHWGFLGGYTERAEALYIALRLREGHFRLQHLALNHDKMIPVQLGISRSHYH